ncbi:Lipid A export ATP-binding/permease protein MsbA [Hypsizygus marmoreus]|uniref:Lipid A export ATP-binding/permease protein MsbA n=1 Tax=Hypsizygus marmoreus TaxID=39966 RepID=A0A369JTG9_HYPMA|nr:Lipid A export ATP-binding/permease protein MsbA [Hypsizygus marmoreus]
METTYLLPKAKTILPSTATRLPAVKRKTWDIFDIAYDQQPSRPSLTLKLSDIRGSLGFLWRFILEVWCMAPGPFAQYLLSCFWISISPAFSLYIAHTTLGTIQECIVDLEKGRVGEVPTWVFAWLFLEALSALVAHLKYRAELSLGGELKARFVPQLARGSLALDVKLSKDRQLLARHGDRGYQDYVPGLSVLEELSKKAGSLLAFFLELSILVYILIDAGDLDAQILTYIFLAFFLVVFAVPTNAIGGAGTFPSLSVYCLYAKDGAARYLSEEYQRTSDALGVVRVSPWILATRLDPPFYWALARSLIIHYPLALYVTVLPWGLTPSSLASMAFLQYATILLRDTSNNLRTQFASSDSILNAVNGAKRFYEILENATGLQHGNVPYPLGSSSPQGMSLTFRDVCFRYPSTDIKENALVVNAVSCSILPGQLVVIVGVNGSGKSSLLNLLPRLESPTSGEILVDGRPLDDYNVDQLRKSMVFLSQTEELYPVSLKENLLMGLPDDAHRVTDKTQMLDMAAQLGGCYELIKREGYDAVVDTHGIVGQSVPGFNNGNIGPGAVAEHARHLESLKPISLSGGEKQRIIAARTFLRLLCSDPRLLVVDEPTSALDAIAERDLFSRFKEMRKGRTTIFVSHHFGNLVKDADLILCMDEGRIAQRGTHAELIGDKNGAYFKLYDAQAAGF